ncbi:prolyl oligopeptidase family serine peptidase [Aestuariibaculum sp. M13]|uniref:alpha/beta hydrolase family esterase n=1 Tax=Aestuariibaculum sp. M13 TaxID=2967132 RepID=UPI002159DBCA|nr:PHB depolymerase family esterase [Aestuariibaculum sp. M13]MCR8666316.1 prolyl oligopeptidase family serine peptidase [Aestuariibaculum sp. M13]
MKQIKHITLFSSFCLLLILCSCKRHLYDFNYQHDSLNRTYQLYIPSNLSENAPLVFVLHAYGRFAKGHLESLELDSIAEKNNFIICYPQGTLDINTGKPYWNSELPASDIDDIGFLTNLAKHIQNKYKLNPGRTFVCGISNGGFMSYTLVRESPDVFKAMASVTGTMTGITWKKRFISPQPVPVLQISGLADKSVPIDGTMSEQWGWGGAPHMDKVIDYWVKLNNCSSVDTIKSPSNIHAYHFKYCDDNNLIWYYKLEGFGHDMPTKGNSGLNSNELIWEFFSQL